MSPGHPSAVHEPAHAICQTLNVEVERQSQLVVAEPQIRKQLRVMDRQELGDRLDLHDDCLVHKEIDAKTDVDPDSLVGHRHWDLPQDVQPSLPELIVETSLVG